MAALRPCPVPGCAELVDGGGRCAAHVRSADVSRRSAARRGYGSRHERLFRAPVLGRAGYICQLCGWRVATVADHYPMGRDELVLKGLNPFDPKFGRALCAACHGRETAAAQPGGWNIRR